MFTYLALSCLVAVASAGISENCLRCICRIEGCESQIGKCRPDAGSLSCGPFQIKNPYWQDCGRPGAGWQPCTKQMECSKTCVRNYMALYGTGCTGGRTPTCEDYARIHNGGPGGCKIPGTIKYWQKVQRCCASIGGCGFESEVLRYEAAGIEEEDSHRMAEDV